jgi:hypothetical protein
MTKREQEDRDIEAIRELLADASDETREWFADYLRERFS